MDRERDRDVTEALIEEHDQKEGGGEPDRVRPGQSDGTSRPVDGQKPPRQGDREPEPEPDAPTSSDPGPFAPH